MDQRKTKCGGYGMFTGIYGIVGLGILFGVLLGIPFKPAAWTPSDAATVLATGLALAYVVLAAIDWIAQTVALAKNPLPAELDLSDRSVARERMAALTSCALLQRHVRRLLSAWAAGASGPQVAAMAANNDTLANELVLLISVACVALLVFVARIVKPKA